MSLTFKKSHRNTNAQLKRNPTRMRVNSFAVPCALLAVLLLAGGCSSILNIFRQSPDILPPAADLYQTGENDLNRRRYADARIALRRIVERHPQSDLAPRARFLIGETFYREAEFEKAVKEFEAFLAFYPRHAIADLVQYRLAMSYYDQIKPVEQDQALTAKALEAFRVLAREYPDSRYAADALAKIDVCRGRLAQKELFIASYYLNQGNRAATRQRLEGLLKEYPRTLVVPEALFRLAEIEAMEGRTQIAQETYRRLATEFAHIEWGRRASQRLTTATR
jgi:outer membrane protein assembly factor BamD